MPVCGGSRCRRIRHAGYVDGGGRALVGDRWVGAVEDNVRPPRWPCFVSPTDEGAMRALTHYLPRLGVALFLSGACAGGDAPPDGPGVTRSDSAGITIVETTRPAWETGESWMLDREPQLVIGRLEGEAPYLFGEARGAVRLDDGSIAVVDNQARELRWFDPTGKFVRSVGRPGEGPEEFRTSAWSLERCGPNWS
jgi:hypothetical protein